MVPANYFQGKEEAAEAEAETETETEFAAYEEEPAYENPVYEETTEEYAESEDYTEESTEEYTEAEEPAEESADTSSAPVNMFAPPPPPPPMPQQMQQSNPVEEIENSSALKLKCNALFLDSKFAKTKGQLMLESALYLCSGNSSIEHCYDLSELRDYDALELKLTLNSGEKIAIGLGKKDAKRMAELVHEISGYEEEVVICDKSAPALPRAPIVVGPKMPESTMTESKMPESTTSAATATKTPMLVGVSFEGLEGDEISIFEGEEVYLLPAGSEENGQFARIEKINGVQGIVPRNFLMSRSEYQKQQQRDNELKISELRIEQQQKEEEEVKKSNVELSGDSKPSRITSNNTVARNNSVKRSGNAWSALASGSSVTQSAPPTQSTKSAVKLENSRLWKDKSGKFQVEAEFVSLKDGKVTIVKASGSQVSVPLDVLSDRDVEFACKRAGLPVPKKAAAVSAGASAGGTVVKGFDWLAFFLSVGFEVGKAKVFGEKFASQSFEESMISAFTSEFLSAQGMEMTEIYKLLPEAAKRKAQMMQASAKEKHRNNNSQMVVPADTSSSSAGGKSTLVPFKPSEQSLTRAQAHVPAESSVEIQSFPTIEELEAQGAIELTPSKSQVTLPGGIQVTSNQSSSSSSSSDQPKILVQPILEGSSNSNNSKERSREVIGADGSSAKEYTRISTSTTMMDGMMGNNAIALLQQQMQNNAMVQAQAQAQASAQVQMQMRMQAQAQAQAQMQMQMRAQAQAQAQYAQAQAQQQAQAQYAQQQRMYQQPQQPAVHITIHTGTDKGSQQMNPMTPPMPLMNQPMMQMNGMNNGMMNMGTMGQMGQMSTLGQMGQMVPANPMMMMNPSNLSNGLYNPFDPTAMPPAPNPFYPNNNGFGF